MKLSTRRGRKYAGRARTADRGEFTKLPELVRGNSVTLVTDTIAVRGYRIECEKIGLKPEERSDDSRRQRRDSRERDRR